MSISAQLKILLNCVINCLAIEGLKTIDRISIAQNSSG